MSSDISLRMRDLCSCNSLLSAESTGWSFQNAATLISRELVDLPASPYSLRCVRLYSVLPDAHELI